MTRRITIVCALLLAASASVAARDITLTLLGGGQVVAGREFDPLADDDALMLAHLELGLELPELLEGFSLELGYEFGEKNADLYAGQQPWLRTGLQLHGVLLGAAYRLALGEWLAVSARVGASLGFVRLRLTTDGGPQLQDWANAKLGGFGTLGLEVALPRKLWRRWLDRAEGDPRDGFTLGVRFEAGWAWRQALEFDQLEGSSADVAQVAAKPISRLPVDLGDLHLDGFLFRIGAFVVF